MSLSGPKGRMSKSEKRPGPGPKRPEATEGRLGWKEPAVYFFYAKTSLSKIFLYLPSQAAIPKAAHRKWRTFSISFGISGYQNALSFFAVQELVLRRLLYLIFFSLVVKFTVFRKETAISVFSAFSSKLRQSGTRWLKNDEKGQWARASRFFEEFSFLRMLDPFCAIRMH